MSKHRNYIQHTWLQLMVHIWFPTLLRSTASVLAICGFCYFNCNVVCDLQNFCVTPPMLSLHSQLTLKQTWQTARGSNSISPNFLTKNSSMLLKDFDHKNISFNMLNRGDISDGGGTRIIELADTRSSDS